MRSYSDDRPRSSAAVFVLLSILVLLLFVADILWGSVSLPFSEVVSALTGQDGSEVYRQIVLQHRLPKAFTAVLTGIALSASGVLMQSLFRNPLAGPDVLGVSAGASLGVALLTLSAGAFPLLLTSVWGQAVAAVVGSLAVLLVVIITSLKLPQSTSLLIVGLMIGYLAGALVSVLQSAGSAESLKHFVTWTFGSLSAVGTTELAVMAAVVLPGAVCTLALQKPLNALLPGEDYARGVGIDTKRTRIFIILITAILTGTSVAFTGPISFIGITMPHLARGLMRTADHRRIIPSAMLCGMVVMLACDLLSQTPGLQGTLPINSVTALFGAPIIIAIILRSPH